MFGIRFIKVQPTTYLIQYNKGKVQRQGQGLSFFYYAPTTSLVAIPVASTEASFIFTELTSDFQEVSVQGEVTYRIADPGHTAKLLNFTLDATGRKYVSDDPEKLSQRVINVVRVLIRKAISTLPLRRAVRSSEEIVREILTALRNAEEILSLGLEILGIAILEIRPTPETSRALEAEMREQLLREADQAIYARRNAAVEQERAIKENELNTEIAVENKKRQIRETQMEAEKSVQEKRHQLLTADMESKIALEDQNRALVDLAIQNRRAEADAKAYAVTALMKAFEGVDSKKLQALMGSGMMPDQLIALAFQELAERAETIGNLNISPELLGELLASRHNRSGHGTAD
ncbi:MAG: SPFH domain-containing protein [Ignavibacteriae bacterium]|nr:SPFH domain-containing protein [Ignavibacteriota bacterium]MCB9214334.1 SPFH domain-containing protein [Ignavibacteria bacterium]